jgi:outer membrane protein
MYYSIKKTPQSVRLFFTGLLLVAISARSVAQDPAPTANDSLLTEATLENVIQYALRHQPAIQEALTNEQITESNIKSRLSDWYPQVNFGYTYQRNFELPVFILGTDVRRIGVDNNSAIQFTANQNIFNRDVLLASRTARDVRTLARQNTSASKIDVAVSVMKAFYDVLTTMQQIKATAEDTVRLSRSLRDAYNQYRAGVVDRTDYKRATIALNNSRAQLNSGQELLKARLEYLKSLMGYPRHAELNIQFDSLQMENSVDFDTTTDIDYNRRIEYQQLATQRRLQEADLRYNKWGYIPSLSANGAYIFNYQDNEFSKLYNTAFKNAYAGVSLTWPIFQGGRRRHEINASRWQLKNIDWSLERLRNNINAEYAQALAAYKSNLINYNAIKENLLLAQEVYDVIQLQYRSGIKTYLEVITAETDLRTARINYFNALNQVLAAKVDVQRALGLINY